MITRLCCSYLLLAQKPYPGLGPEFVKSVAVDSFIDGIHYREVQSLVPA